MTHQSPDSIKVLVVDDHPMVIEGMKAMLSQLSFVQLLGTAGHAVEAIALLRKHPDTDVAIVDINMPDISGIELAGKIRIEFPRVRVLAMSTFNERSYISQMIQQGASGYLVKSAAREEIEEAILSAYEGKMYLSADLQQNSFSQKTTEKQPLLTSREKEVLKLIADGLTNPQIAQQLYISLHTVDSHRKNLLAKFGVNNTAGLIKHAVQYGIVQ